MNKYIILSLVAFISAQSPQLKQVVISSGAIQSDQVKGTVGQPIIGRSEANNTVLSAGFWGSIAQMFLNVDEEVLPTEYSISKAYPNPFNPVTNIDIAIPESGEMQFAIFDILGRQVFTHKQNFATPGHYRFSWSGKNNQGAALSSGVYLMTFQFAENYTKQKITLLK